jgi:hypothetical protein
MMHNSEEGFLQIDQGICPKQVFMKACNDRIGIHGIKRQSE